MFYTFENQQFFWLLPLLLCLLYCKKEPQKIFLPKLSWIPKRSRYLNTQTLLKISIFLLTILALASPITYDNIKPTNRYGVDIVIALDCSGSMRESGFSALDVQISKFELLQNLTSNFIDNRPSDNIGIVAFGSFAFSASPVTYDHQSLKEMLIMLEVEIAGKNTAIGDAIAQSIKTLEFAQAKNKIIILITDGISNSGKTSVKQAVKLAKEKNIKIYTIGLGDKKEYNTILLTKVSNQTKAKSFSAHNAIELENIYKEINRLHPTKIRSQQYLNKQLLFQYPLFLAIILSLLLIKSNRSKLLYLSLILMLIALLKPTIPTSKTDIKLKASDIILALDLSKSMSATDIKPSRVIKAKKIIKYLIKQNPNERFTLFAFTSNTLILSPPTTDTNLLISAVDSLQSNNILTHATSIKNLLLRVSKLNIKEKNLIIFSDGGENLDIKSLLNIARKNHINIYCIGIATKKGTTLKDKNNKILKDSKQNIIISKLNPQLHELSTKYIDIDDFNYKLDFITKQDFSSSKKFDNKEFFIIPLLFSLLFFMIYFINIPKKLLLLLPFLASSIDANILDWYYIKEANSAYHARNYKKAIIYFNKITSPTIESKLNTANSYYQNREYKHAIQIYQSLKSTDKEIKKLIYFKLGNAYSMIKDYKKAKQNYTNALNLKRDSKTLQNLKIIAFKITKKDHTKQEKTSKKQYNIKSSNKNRPTKTKKSKNSKNKNKQKTLTRPLGYKAYELINEGYIDEKTPW